MGADRLGNLRSSASGRNRNDLSLFLSPFFCQPFEARLVPACYFHVRRKKSTKLRYMIPSMSAGE